MSTPITQGIASASRIASWGLWINTDTVFLKAARAFAASLRHDGSDQSGHCMAEGCEDLRGVFHHDG
eukprot:15461344-Alexandrium_andersonii.AAC.1